MKDFEVYKNYCQTLDLNFSENIMEKLGQFGDDKDTGNRSAGSKACYDAAKYLYSKFNEAGLTSVSMDKFQVNGWTYKGANLSYFCNRPLYHSFFDDANGVSIMLGISKAIIESGYMPMKTIRIIEFTLRMNYMNILENP